MKKKKDSEISNNVHPYVTGRTFVSRSVELLSQICDAQYHCARLSETLNTRRRCMSTKDRSCPNATGDFNSRDNCSGEAGLENLSTESSTRAPSNTRHDGRTSTGEVTGHVVKPEPCVPERRWRRFQLALLLVQHKNSLFCL